MLKKIDFNVNDEKQITEIKKYQKIFQIFEVMTEFENNKLVLEKTTSFFSIFVGLLQNGHKILKTLCSDQIKIKNENKKFMFGYIKVK
jgi:hypothetical protein